MSYALISNGDTGFPEYLKSIKSAPILSVAEEIELSNRWNRDGDIKAAQILVMSHVRLVVKIAQKFRGYGLPIVDIISEGNIGLMKAVKKFDPKMGCRLATYAIWWIKATIQDYVLKSWSMVKIGTSALQKKMFFNLKKVQNRIVQANIEKDVNRTAAKQLGVSIEDVEYMDRIINIESLDDEKNDASINNLYGESAANVEELVIEAHDKKQKLQSLTIAMSSLSEREKSIINSRYLSETPSTLDSLSVAFNVSRERIRQIEARALEKIREIMSRDESKQSA